MPYIVNGRSRLYYEVRGAGETIVFLHGGGGNHASFYYQIAEFEKYYRVVTYDARGFGNSPDVEKLGRFGNLPDLEVLFDSLEIAKAVIVAQSMGGGAGVGMLCTHPDRVLGLVMADTLTGIALPPDLRSELQAVRERTKPLSQPVRVLGATTSRTRPIAATLYTQIASFNELTVATLFGDYPEFTFEQMSATKRPVYFVVGDEDVLCPSSLARKAHERFAGSQFTEITESGHSAYFEQHEQFNGLLHDWLRRTVFVGV